MPNRKSCLMLGCLPLLLMNVQANIVFAQGTGSGEVRLNVKEDNSLLDRTDNIPIEESDTTKMLRECNNNIDSDGKIILPENASSECTRLFNEIENALSTNNPYCSLPDGEVPAGFKKAKPLKKEDLDGLGISFSDAKAERKLANEIVKDIKKNCKRTVRDAKKIK
jgi:hypothetical protein